MATGAELRLPGSGTVVFIGFMGSGKTTAAECAARALHAEAIDIDRLLEQRLGKPIPQVFAEDGEAFFRQAEERITLELLGEPSEKILALGGGTVGSAAVRDALRDHLVIWVDVDPQTAWARVEGTGRPLAQDRSSFERLHGQREPLYASLADVTIPAARSQQIEAVLAALEGLPAGSELLWAASASGDYPAYVGNGLLAEHGFWPATVGGRRFLVTDGNVGRLYGEALAPLHARVAVMPGEQSKTVAHAEIVWTELMQAGMTHDDVVVALGGGVVGDLAGFCAATYQRGVDYVQVPTSLVAQVDSAYGGKTGVDLPEAKNYVGAYHQPIAVIADPSTLRTLPEAEVAAGYAEVLKTALIAGGGLWEQIAAGAEPTAPSIIASCVRTKLRIVAQDERDSGIRQVLNLGHTVAHALETVTGYARYRHGEAVGLGLLAALSLSGQAPLRDQVRELLEAHRLPTALDGEAPEAVAAATGKDKKRRGAAPVPFVLLDRPGAPRPGCPVRSSEVLAAVRELAG
jgi:shikimate kinase / 3-dehydroquinate synthase